MRDQRVGELRNDRAAEPDAGQGDAERQSAARVEPCRDRLGVAERRLDRTRHLGQRKQ
jgi:hypothetical protein